LNYLILKKKPKETVKSENVLPTEIPGKITVHSDSSLNIDFDSWLKIFDINDLGNIKSDPSRSIMKVDICTRDKYWQYCLAYFLLKLFACKN
jgi:hypothetical protein